MAKQASRFLALLRGINVGGKNIIPKDDLRGCFEDLGCSNVRTYIQSGNVLFRCSETSVKKLTELVETGLSERFSYDAQAVILTHRKYKSAVAAAPQGWGTNTDQKHNAMFTLGGITPKKVLQQLATPKAEIETVTMGPGVIFWSVSKKYLTKTTLMRLAQEQVYQQMTVRNHNTVFKLLELFESI
ncbi:MAG: DUF1697 domain-containing protein [Pirellulales bacterium]|nr:DUF1697 domain-containing protein [Pirellulales bacterium]